MMLAEIISLSNNCCVARTWIAARALTGWLKTLMRHKRGKVDMKKTILIIAILLPALLIVEAEAAPAFRAAGGAVNGTKSVSPARPAHAVRIKIRVEKVAILAVITLALEV